jgi:hypothetical protein
MVHLHIHLDARAWGNDDLEQIRSARAFAQLGYAPSATNSAIRLGTGECALTPLERPRA